MKTMLPAKTTFRASIALENQPGSVASAKNSSPPIPVSRKTAMNPTNQRTADRTSMKTSAPSGARMPHTPTTPEGVLSVYELGPSLAEAEPTPEALLDAIRNTGV